ncbi:MAG: hypothetical protein ACJA1C_003258 [Crocinitomicaceae bacterium]|jgi:hypothetical protein
MKLFFLSILLIVPLIGTSQLSIHNFFERTNSFLETHTHKGRVNYPAIMRNGSELTALLGFVENVDLQTLDTNATKALLINAYNLMVIKQVVSHAPISSPQDVNGFFAVTEFNVAGERMTLNHLENNILRKKYSDPRYHFVLVCGALGCPPIGSFAYTPINIEEQLELQSTKALNDTNFVYEKDGNVYLSEIFNWYRSDFKIDGKSEVDYINGYRKTKLESRKIKYYPYDWTLNKIDSVAFEEGITDLFLSEIPVPKFDLQRFTAGSLLSKGTWDITSFNTIYTQTKSNWQGVDYSGFRETFVTSLWQVTYGISKNERINIGLDINLKSSASSTDSTFSGTWRAFDFKNNDSTRVGITSIGPRIKILPFKNVSTFTIQSTFLIPTIEHPEGYSNPDGSGNGNLYWSDWNRFISWNQFFYTKTWGDFQLFTEVDLLFRIRRSKEQITHMDLPVSVIGSYFLTPKFTLYGIAQHVTRHTYDIFPQESNDWVISMNYSSVGAGIKYQPASNLTLELLYTNFVRGVNSGIGNTFNFGIKYITK